MDAGVWLWRPDCRVVISSHAAKAFIQRGVNKSALRRALAEAEELESYPPGGYPHWNYLLLAEVDAMPLHIVVADNIPDNEVIVVTAYQPDPGKWEPGWRTRR